MIGWAIYELTPAPWGDDYRFIVIRDTEKAANEILDLLDETDYSFSVYKIVEFKR
jgi:hypothetical protein